MLGPLGALIILVIAFSIFTENFLSVDNTSLILQQSVVVGTLALGQTIIILTGGIDLANGAIMVLGSLVMANARRRTRASSGRPCSSACSSARYWG